MADTSNVAAAKPKIGGAISVAPAGTTLPTDSTTALATTFTSLGYVSEDGLVNDENTDTEAIHAWGGDTVLVLAGEHTDTYNWTLLEVLDANVQKFVRGASNVTVSAAGAITVTANSSALEEHVIVVDMLFRGRAVRHVIPRGVITERGETTYSDDDAVGYEVTVTALPDASGNTHYEYIAAPTASA